MSLLVLSIHTEHYNVSLQISKKEIIVCRNLDLGQPKFSDKIVLRREYFPFRGKYIFQKIYQRCHVPYEIYIYI